MGMSLDHCIHCAFSCLVLNMLHDCVLCDVNYIHVYGKRETLRLENVTLGVICIM